MSEVASNQKQSPTFSILALNPLLFLNTMDLI